MIELQKEIIEKLYIKEGKSKIEVASILGVSESVLNKWIGKYQIQKKPRCNSVRWLLDNINKEDFIYYYSNHNIKDTAFYYNTSVNYITQYCKEIRFTKDSTSINNQKKISRSIYEKNRIQSYINKLPKELLYRLSIEENKSHKEISQMVGLSEDIICKLSSIYNIHRDRKEIYKTEMNKKFSSEKEMRDHFLKVRNENWIKKYGSLDNLWKERQGKIEGTNIKLYGVPHVMSNPKIKHQQAKSARKSSLEGRFEEFLIQNNFSYIHGYMVEGTPYNHEFDFAIFKEDKLDILVDCDGTYYHGYETDENGKSVNTYIDDYRSQLVPEGVKFLVCLEGEEEKAYSEVLKLINIDYNKYIQEVFDWCREVEFPYPKYKCNILNNSYNSLLKSDINSFSMNARYGMKIIDHFHPSIWKANRDGSISPYEAWQKDDLLIKCIKNRVIYKGCNLDRSKVLAGFSINKIAPKVSLFNPNLAKYIVGKYLSNYKIIFDPCSGYSGRMLGVCSLGKRYIGQDINPETVKESKDIVKYFNLDASVECKNLLEDSGDYECLFTCPPYGSKEKWNQEIKNKSCDEWIEEILSRYKCKEYIFVVDKTEKYLDYIVEELKNKSHFGSNLEYVIKISRLSSQSNI
jgi:hypothetical protein